MTDHRCFCFKLILSLTSLIRAHGLPSSSRLNVVFVKPTNNGLGGFILRRAGCRDGLCTLSWTLYTITEVTEPSVC